ncbi:MAG: hypothetical protein H7172_01500 [Ferruginibacter sp.]|nr:hypothetical protein [Rhodoferax sp.]
MERRPDVLFVLAARATLTKGEPDGLHGFDAGGLHASPRHPGQYRDAYFPPFVDSPGRQRV